MQVSVETTSGLERRLTIGVPAEKIENEVTSRLQKAAKTLRVDGFRRGKVPIKVVRQRYGTGVRQEVLGEVINRSFYEAVAKENIRPAGAPNIEPVKDEPGEDFEFVATFEVYPEFELADFSDLSLEKPVASVSDQDLEKMLEVLRKQQATWEPVDRAAALEDQVNIDYVGRRGGEEFAGGKADGADLVLGSGQMIPGFEDAVVGMSAGDSKTVELIFPEDYKAAELRGASVEFDIRVNAVKEQMLPEIDEDYYARFGIENGDHEKFLTEVRANMERELRNALNSKIKSRVMARLLEMHDVSVPRALLKTEIDGLRRQMMEQFGGGKNIDPSMLPDELFAERAEKRVALGLVVARIIEQAGLKADADKVNAYIEDLASTYEQPEEVISYYHGNKELLRSVESAVLEDQVIDYLLQKAQVTEKPCSYEEALTPENQDASVA